MNLKLVNENNLNESNHPQMMALYAAIIKGQKLEVKKLLTGEKTTYVLLAKDKTVYKYFSICTIFKPLL